MISGERVSVLGTEVKLQGQLKSCQYNANEFCRVNGSLLCQCPNLADDGDQRAEILSDFKESTVKQVDLRKQSAGSVLKQTK